MMSLTMTDPSSSRPARWLLPFAVGFCLTVTMPRAAQAQWRDAVAVSAVPVASASQSSMPATLGVAPNGDTWQTREFWHWTGIGVLTGAVVGAGWLALEMASSKSDGSMIGPAIPLLIVGTVGGAGGGLIGAIAYVAAHPAPDQPR